LQAEVLHKQMQPLVQLIIQQILGLELKQIMLTVLLMQPLLRPITQQILG
jgi:hypothetical protein